VAKQAVGHAVGQERLMKRIVRGEELLILILSCQKCVPSIIMIEDNTRRKAWWIEERNR
jgi:hypothetical protein